ncbi:Leucine-rich repeat receptor protein kinase EMS1 [Striga hermonthica]|uniref:non-specific serine/threonine protein kinase n=1 Tax=Striga hermonthica TaxID=68872 RepID=A0A9N7NK41_STRHE|nr:Leucine-rich repeat receptor protein kinase EMS1 [Striga hermonthica]
MAVLLLHCIFFLFQLVFSQNSENPDGVGLLEFKGSLENPEALLSWSPASPHCNWTGVFCTHGRSLSNLKSLKTLDLSNNPLQSPIPKFIGDWQNLTVLNLIYAQLSGSIPPEIGNCKNLNLLLLSFNSLTGFLPNELSGLSPTTFSVERNQLSGPLPAWLGKWEHVDALLLSENKFSGIIPPEIGNCSVLSHISLEGNLLTGEIPKELCNARFLNEIELGNNFLGGSLDDTFSNCRNLTQLVLMNNKIHGVIPDYFADLPLISLELDSNNFTGTIPVRLWSSSTLIEFSASDNQLEGSLPAEIGNALSLQVVVLSNNYITGKIPDEIGKLQSLSVLNLNSNYLEGNIPAAIGNCTELGSLDLGSNRLNGSIPEEIVGLPQLLCLILSHNNLSGPIPSKNSKYFQQDSVIPASSFLQHIGVYDLSFNQLTGSIPEVLGDCSVLTYIFLNGNSLSGEIPDSLSRLSNLTTLDLTGNLLYGNIPFEIGDTIKLQGLYLGDNRFTGQIPETLGKLNGLVKLNLSSNMLSGPVPIGLSKLSGLTHLDLSTNMLTGELPVELSRMVNLVGLYAQHNRLSGRIDHLFGNLVVWRLQIANLSCNSFTGTLPSSLGNMSYLTVLDLHRNSFTGRVPPELGNLAQIQYLDISENSFDGQIPPELCAPTSLYYLNLAENELNGPVPRNGLCRKINKSSLTGNKNLCGRVLDVKCPLNNFRAQKKLPLTNVWGLVSVSIGTILIILTVIIVLRIWLARYGHAVFWKEAINDEMDSIVSNQTWELVDLPAGSKPIGCKWVFREKYNTDGSIQTFKARLVAKGFKQKEGIDYFDTYVPLARTTSIRILFQAPKQWHEKFDNVIIPYGFRHNNADKCLYSKYCDDYIVIVCLYVDDMLILSDDMRGIMETKRFLSLTFKMKDLGEVDTILVGSARGLAFLHHGFIPHIIHRDIKASNILLDEDFEPKVADFGLARLISACETHVSTDIAGTFGYIPPEYGQSWKSTTRGDVYSFGVILLELLTGKEPTGPDFKDVEGGNLVGWVVGKVKAGKAVEVLDREVLDADSKQMMLRTLQIAVLCLSENPAGRPTMLHVLKFLKGIQDELEYDA